ATTPMRPAPPVRFSTTTDRLRPVRSLSAIRRASASPPPPAANGKIMRIGCSCACAAASQTSVAANATRPARHRSSIIASLLRSHILNPDDRQFLAGVILEARDQHDLARVKLE